MIKYTGFSETGNSCKGINQDAILMHIMDNVGLFAVADGMGGLERGEEASGYVISELQRFWDERIRSIHENSIQQLVFELKTVLENCNSSLYKMGETLGASGCTIVLLLIIDGYYAVISAGDSRCYRIWKKWLGIGWQQLSVDDVWENNSDNTVGLTENAMRSHRNYGRLTGAIGISEDFAPNVRTGMTSETDLFMLMSDGIYKMVGIKEMMSGIKGSLAREQLDEIQNRIREAVYKRGAADNLSLILVRP